MPRVAWQRVGRQGRPRTPLNKAHAPSVTMSWGSDEFCYVERLELLTGFPRSEIVRRIIWAAPRRPRQAALLRQPGHVLVSVALDAPVLTHLEHLVQAWHVSNRSEVVSVMIREHLARHGATVDAVLRQKTAAILAGSSSLRAVRLSSITRRLGSLSGSADVVLLLAAASRGQIRAVPAAPGVRAQTDITNLLPSKPKETDRP